MRELAGNPQIGRLGWHWHVERMAEEQQRRAA
jgi:hypothetical protein